MWNRYSQGDGRNFDKRLNDYPLVATLRFVLGSPPNRPKANLH